MWVGNLGYSHHAIQDYSLIRCFPNMLIASPGDIMELNHVLNIVKNPQPSCEINRFKLSNTKKPNISPGKWLKF